MLEYLDLRGKREYVLSIAFALYIIFFCIATYIATLFVYEWLGILVGVALTLIGVVLHRLGKRDSDFYLSALILNGVATGFAVSAYYIVMDVALVLTALVFPICALLSYFLLNLLISRLGHKKLFIILFSVLVGIALLSSVAVWIFLSAPLGSAAFFVALLAFFIVAGARALGTVERSALRELSLASFGAFVVATLVVVAIISDGDAVDALDLTDGTKKRKGGAVKK